MTKQEREAILIDLLNESGAEIHSAEELYALVDIAVSLSKERRGIEARSKNTMNFISTEGLPFSK